MLFCSISNGYVGSICMMSAPQVKRISPVCNISTCIFSDCSIWRRSDCRFSDGGSAWPWPWQRGLPLQLLRHAHLVLQCQALQQLLELWNRLPFFGSLSPSCGQAELLTSVDRFLEIITPQHFACINNNIFSVIKTYLSKEGKIYFCAEKNHR